MINGFHDVPLSFYNSFWFSTFGNKIEPFKLCFIFFCNSNSDFFFFFLFIYIHPSILLKEISYSGSQFMLQLNKGIFLFRLALTLDALYLSGGSSSSIWLTAQYLDFIFFGFWCQKTFWLVWLSIPSRNEISGPGILLPRMVLDRWICFTTSSSFIILKNRLEHVNDVEAGGRAVRSSLPDPERYRRKQDTSSTSIPQVREIGSFPSTTSEADDIIHSQILSYTMVYYHEYYDTIYGRE